ncbi:UNVERIFIED_CONTAM: hypothetical protein Sradi_3949800 [Sesamum radiatum]|uniref:SAM domain-containing protein n=1 Tax=Sesamum radiatum TaxID=300843 RepID=A0AAW2PJH1_SESRA
MQNGGGETAAAEVNVGPTKRMRRPSVRLHQPYYENPGHRKLRQQWKAIKEDTGGARKPRTAKTVHAKSKKNDGVSDSSKGIGISRGRESGPSSKKWASMKSRDNEDPEIEKFPLSSGGESGKQGEADEGEEEENLGANGVNSNLVVENSDPSSPNCSFGDDGNDNDNVGGNLQMKQRGWRNGPYFDQMGDEGRTAEGESYRDSDGVRLWLNQLGLGKYASLFEVHEVDDEVLPFLTLEDLKDMGINAVGSRRKMFSSIQKLGKGFI